MAKRQNRGLKLIGVPVEPDLYDAIEAFAAENGGEKPLPMAEVCRKLLREAFVDGAGERVAADLADTGYQDGRRRGMHEAHQHMKKLWGGK